MNLSSLAQLLQNKVTVLQTARGQAYSAGDLNQLNAIDTDLLETQNTLAQLGALSNIAQAASAANASLTDVAVSGIAAVQDTSTVQGPSASAIVNGYNISAYATDPSYEEKIRNILSKMPTFSLVGDIDRYIQAVAQGSPVTGDMIYNASQQYSVDLPLMTAIMQNDSAFGTLGIGASTFNPGNIGNTGTSTQAFPSWNDGVTAVANWLNNHRVVVPTSTPTPDPTTTPQPDPSTVDTTDATTTPTVTLPSTPIVVATSTAAFIIPTVSTSTPFVNSATSTLPFTDPATSTPPIINPDPATTTPSTASSTPTTAATSTPPTNDSGSTTATSTPDIGLPDASSTPTTDASSTPDSGFASSTPPSWPVTDPGAASSTLDVPPTASSTPDANASTTQARRVTIKRQRA